MQDARYKATCMRIYTITNNVNLIFRGFSLTLNLCFVYIINNIHATIKYKYSKCKLFQIIHLDQYL